MKKIVFCNFNGLNPYDLSGAEITIDEFLSFLVKNNYQILSINCNEKWLFYNDHYKKTSSNDIEILEGNYMKIFFHNREAFKCNAINIIKDFQPDIIISQLNFLEELYEYSKVYGCKIIYFMHSSFEHGLTSDKNYNILSSSVIYKIICLSDFIRKLLPRELWQKAEVMYPIIPREKYFIGDVKPQNILFFNPIKIKGVEIILKLAEEFENEKFYVCESWYHAKDNYKKLMQQRNNIVLLDNRDIKEVLKMTKIYLLPSQCDEGFGRGIVEANINSIPIIASNVGGVKEAAGERQLLIDKYDDVNEWISTLDFLLNEKNYKKYVKNAYDNSLRFENFNVPRWINEEEVNESK